MTINENDLVQLIRYRLHEAKDTIADVQILIDHKRFRAAINRIYYGMFYALLALGLRYEFQSSKHRQLIGWFNKHFIHKGIIEEKYGRIINKAYNRRTKGDYDSFVEFDEETVWEMYIEMKDFISTLTDFINMDK